MAKLINAKCPNCGAILELPENLDRAFCMHCGGKVIIAKDVHYHGGKTAIACPECGGKGYVECQGEVKEVKPSFKPHWLFKCIYFKHPCYGTGKCTTKYELKKRFTHIYCQNGKCRPCKGTGRLFPPEKCKTCMGTKICFICNGTGKCTYCNGTGKFKCKACNGTGFKVYEGEV